MTIHESPWEMCASGCRDWMGLRRGFTSGQRERENPLLRPTAQPGISPRNPHTSRSLRRAMAVNQAKDNPCKPDHIDRRLCYPDRLMKRDSFVNLHMCSTAESSVAHVRLARNDIPVPDSQAAHLSILASRLWEGDSAANNASRRSAAGPPIVNVSGGCQLTGILGRGCVHKRKET